jgi:hypothetical protein
MKGQFGLLLEICRRKFQAANRDVKLRNGKRRRSRRGDCSAFCARCGFQEARQNMFNLRGTPGQSVKALLVLLVSKPLPLACERLAVTITTFVVFSAN